MEPSYSGQLTDLAVTAAGDRRYFKDKVDDRRALAQRDGVIALSAVVTRLVQALCLAAEALDEQFPDEPTDMQNDLLRLAAYEEAILNQVRGDVDRG